MIRTGRFRPAKIIFFLLLVISFGGCISAKRTPNLERIFAEARVRKGKRPIIVIPGILGSQLLNSRTGEVVWPSVLRSRDDGSSLPMSPDLAGNRDDVVAGRIVETLKLARILPEVYVYRDLLEALKHYGGYREADWDQPPPDGDADTYYVYSYDWRRDNVENAQELVRRIERLKTRLGRPSLRFNVLAHSMGGLIARYAAMYGMADLPADDSDPHLTWVGAAHFNKIIMLGVPNEGSADALGTLLYGYSITEGVRRRVPLLNKLTAEDAITSPALFQLLPHGTTAKFLDENLRPIKIDIYDPAVWKLYGWGVVNDDEFRRRYAEKHGAANAQTSASTTANPIAGESEALRNLDAYFVAVLKRAQKFHAALDQTGTIDPPIVLLAVGGDCEETLAAPIVMRDPKDGRWETLTRPRSIRTSTGRKIDKREVVAAMFAPGDGRVTRRSLLGEDLAGQRRAGSLVDSPLSLSYAIFGCDLHSQLQRNKTLQDNALTALVSEALK